MFYFKRQTTETTTLSSKDNPIDDLYSSEVKSLLANEKIQIIEAMKNEIPERAYSFKYDRKI